MITVKAVDKKKKKCLLCSRFFEKGKESGEEEFYLKIIKRGLCSVNRLKSTLKYKAFEFVRVEEGLRKQNG